MAGLFDKDLKKLNGIHNEGLMECSIINGSKNNLSIMVQKKLKNSKHISKVGEKMYLQRLK